MKYLDTNIIIYAIENNPKYGKSCKKILLDIESNKVKVCASILVLSEIINALSKINNLLRNERKKELNVENNINAILSLPITWLDLNFYVIKRASSYDYKISGADYTHVATMELNSINEIITADEDFNKVSILKRIDPLDY